MRFDATVLTLTADTTDLETNQCLENNGGCWSDPKSNITACKDTFRGRVCECPLVDGVHFAGDGYKSCQGIHQFIYAVSCPEKDFCKALTLDPQLLDRGGALWTTGGAGRIA